MRKCDKRIFAFLAERIRPNGRAYATDVLRLSPSTSIDCRRLSVRLWRYVLWLNGASRTS